MAGNIYHACIKALKQYLNSYQDNIPLIFRISRYGFDKHNDDQYIHLLHIIQILNLARQSPICEEINYA